MVVQAEAALRVAEEQPHHCCQDRPVVVVEEEHMKEPPQDPQIALSEVEVAVHSQAPSAIYH